MITKTEVDEALRRTESNTGGGSLDRTLIVIRAGDLFVLREAAKVAPFHHRAGWSPVSNSNLILGVLEEVP